MTIYGVPEPAPAPRPAPVRSRRPPIMLVVIAAALVVAGALTTILMIVNGDDELTPVAGPDTCSANPGRAQVVAYFDGPDADEHMRAAALVLRNRGLVAAVGTETRQEAFQRFNKIFANEPELLKLARPEALPASIWVLPARNAKSEDLATQIRDEFPDAGDIDPDICVYKPRR